VAERRCRNWTTAVVAAAGTGAVLLALLVWAAMSPPAGVRDAAGSLPPSPEPTVSATAAEIQAAHDALHHIGEECAAPGDTSPDVATDVATITAFAARYPVGRFPIDDETGTAVSLLLVTRQALEGCAPEEAARVAALLPPELRYGPEHR
jgi:hypothetical protein